MTNTNSQLTISEIFCSLQGESSMVGVPFVFVRLTGCNLRCTYCDSAHAFYGGTRYRISAVIEEIAKYQTKHVLITGGEPLLQKNTPELVKRLNDMKYVVSIETHGEASIQAVAPYARIVMDIKTPSSGMQNEGYKKNLKYLKNSDEIKFVIGSRKDYEWAKTIVESQTLPCETLLFSPVVAAKASPGDIESFSPRWLADQILRDRLAVRFQIQLHKYLWGNDTIGV